MIFAIVLLSLKGNSKYLAISQFEKIASDNVICKRDL